MIYVRDINDDKVYTSVIRKHEFYKKIDGEIYTTCASHYFDSFEIGIEGVADPVSERNLDVLITPLEDPIVSLLKQGISIRVDGRDICLNLDQLKGFVNKIEKEMGEPF